MDLKGKVALITGGAAGIGKAYSEELLKQGCKVSICDINSDAGDDLVQQLCNRYGKDRIMIYQCDVTDYMQFEAMRMIDRRVSAGCQILGTMSKFARNVNLSAATKIAVYKGVLVPTLIVLNNKIFEMIAQKAFQTTISNFGCVDIVINNAGVMNDRFWELEVDVNLNGVIRGMLLAFRFMGRDRGGRGGIVVNTGSNVCVRPYVSIPIYTATKHAIVGLTRSYGAQYHVNLTGVKVMAICPSATDSTLVKDVKKQLLSPDYENAWKQDTANSQPQKAEHVAKALVQILHKGTSGSCWLVENCQPPKEIPPFAH